MHLDCVRYALIPKRKSSYTLVWLENKHGELRERTDLFEHIEDRTQFVKDMLQTGRLFDLIEAGQKLSN